MAKRKVRRSDDVGTSPPWTRRFCNERRQLSQGIEAAGAHRSWRGADFDAARCCHAHRLVAEPGSWNSDRLASAARAEGHVRVPIEVDATERECAR